MTPDANAQPAHQSPFAMAAHLQEMAAEVAFLRQRNTALAQLALARQVEVQQLQQQVEQLTMPAATPDPDAAEDAA